MKQTHKYYTQSEIERLSELLLAKDLLEEKVRVNLYLPKVVVKLIDSMAKNTSRGGLVSALVLKEVKKKKKLPYGMFSPLQISKKEIDKISCQWEKSINETL